MWLCRSEFLLVQECSTFGLIDACYLVYSIGLSNVRDFQHVAYSNYIYSSVCGPLLLVSCQPRSGPRRAAAFEFFGNLVPTGDHTFPSKSSFPSPLGEETSITIIGGPAETHNRISRPLGRPCPRPVTPPCSFKFDIFRPNSEFLPIHQPLLRLHRVCSLRPRSAFLAPCGL